MQITSFDDEFYDSLADDFEKIYRNWPDFCEWQFKILDEYIFRGQRDMTVIDYAPGIGTQVIPLLERGFNVSAVVNSSNYYEILLKKTRNYKNKPLTVSDFNLNSGKGKYDVALLLDNQLPHLLTLQERTGLLKKIYDNLKEKGRLVLAVRDYENLNRGERKTTPLAKYEEKDNIRLVHQLWDWESENIYRFHLYITSFKDNEWENKYFTSRYYAIKHKELEELLKNTGFKNVDFLSPLVTKYHQWIIVAS